MKSRHRTQIIAALAMTIALAFPVIVLAEAAKKPADELPAAEVMKKLRAIPMDAKVLPPHVPQLLEWMHFHSNSSVQAACADRLALVKTPEVRDALLAILKDPKAHTGGRRSYTWMALWELGALVSDQLVRELIADQKTYWVGGALQLAGRARLEPGTREMILGLYEKADHSLRLDIVRFVEVQLGVISNAKPPEPIPGLVRTQYLKWLQAKPIEDSVAGNRNYAGWLLIQCRCDKGFPVVLEDLESSFKRYQEGKGTLVNSPGELQALKQATGQTFYDQWPADAKEQEKIVVSAIEWLREKVKSNKSQTAKSP